MVDKSFKTDTFYGFCDKCYGRASLFNATDWDNVIPLRYRKGILCLECYQIFSGHTIVEFREMEEENESENSRQG